MSSREPSPVRKMQTLNDEQKGGDSSSSMTDSDEGFVPFAHKKSAIVGGTGEGEPPPVRYTKGLGMRQLGAMLKKNFLLKRRKLCVTCCELLTPVALMAVLVIGYTVALNDVEVTDSMIYANDTSTLQSLINTLGPLEVVSPPASLTLDESTGFRLFSADEFTDLMQKAADADAGFDYEDADFDSSADSSSRRLMQVDPVPAPVPVPAPGPSPPLFPIIDFPIFCADLTQFPGVPPIPLPPGSGSLLCMKVNLNMQSTPLLFSQISQYSGPLSVPDINTFIGISDILRNISGGDDRLPGLSSQFLGNLIQLGDVFFSPDTDEVRAFRDHLLNKSAGFADHAGDVFPTEQAAIDHILADNDPDNLPSKDRTWALMHFDSLSPLDGDVRYAIRMNYSVMPLTQRVTTSSRVMLPGLNTEFQRYYSSGFLTLQREVESYVLDMAQDAGLDADGNDPTLLATLSDLTGANPVSVAFPTPQFDTNPFYAAIGPLAGLIMVMAMLYPSSQLIKAIVEEKESRTKETMKMMGLKGWVFGLNWFLTYFIMFFIICVLIVILLSQNVFQRTDPTVLFAAIFLFTLSLIMFNFLVSVFFSRAKVAAIIGPILLFVCAAPRYAFVNTQDGEQLAAKRASALLSPTGFSYAVDVMINYEGANNGVQWDTINAEPLGVGEVMALLIVDFIVYFILWWYFDKVWPNEFGTKLKWYFPFTKSYWCGPSAADDVDTDSNGADRFNNGDNFEPVPSHFADRAVVQIRGLSKVFTQGLGNTKIETKAVDDLHLNMYRGQVTALLGHNGAGKTTTISMVTGLLGPSSGDALVNGHSIRTEMPEVRQSLGVCPQHNVLFDRLTVFEHLRLYAALKGVHPDEIDEQAERRITDVGLTAKRDVFSSALSGGMKRKLQVAVALIGPSEVIFLDEPTSGMDPYSRRSTWELLRKMKTGRTIILTTHFMDEADLLGDRIAIMSHGQLRTCGSSLFLKARYGVGYTMTLTAANENFDDEDITEIVLNTIPEATVMNVAGGEVSYRLPLDTTAKFPELFAHIEANLKALHIDGYGISMTTLDEVFTRIGQIEDEIHMKKLDKPSGTVAATGDVAVAISDPESSESDEDPAGATPLEKPARESISLRRQTSTRSKRKKRLSDAYQSLIYQLPEDRSMWRQIKNMIEKRWICAKRDLKGRFFEILLPIIVVAFVLLLLQVEFDPAGPALQLNSKLYQQPQFDLGNRRFGDVDQTEGNFTTDIVFGGEIPPELLTALTADSVGHVAFIDANVTDATSVDVSDFLLEEHDLHQNTRYGAYVIDDVTFADAPFNFTLQITNVTTQSFLVANTLSNALTTLFNSTSSHSLPTFIADFTRGIYRTHLGDLDAVYEVSTQPLPQTRQFELLVQSFLALFAAVFVLIPFCYLPASFMIFIVKERSTKSKHLQLVSGAKVNAYWIGTYMWDIMNYTFVLLCVMAVFGLYGNTEFVGTVDAFFATFINLWLYGFAVLPMSYCLSFLFENHSTAQISIAGIHFVLGFVLVIASFILDSQASTMDVNAVLKNFYRLAPQFAMGETLINLGTIPIMNMFSPEQSEPFDWEVASRNIVYMFCEAIFFFTILLMIEHGVFSLCLERIKRRLKSVDYSTLVYKVEDQDVDVKRERERVTSGKASNDLLVMEHLSKVYDPRGNSKEPVIAVNDICLGVPRGQCFGFLGINGAGKTSTLQILTGDQYATAGHATVGGFDIETELQEARQIIGYCPQFDPLLELMSGVEHLTMFARLRGINEEEIPVEVDRLITKLGLTEHADKISGAYSGGNKRKLSLAIALIGDPRVVFLDEPSTGMDPMARRSMWDVISAISKERSVILTTHLMEECEALCNRICIMTSGNFRCLGTIQHLKNRFGQGYHMEISTFEGNVDRVRDFIENTFEGVTLEEFHSGRLQYHLAKEKVSLSSIFGEIERNKQDLGIDDYSISQNTLEQIFVSIARAQDAYAHDDDEAAVAAAANATHDTGPNKSSGGINSSSTPV